MRYDATDSLSLPHEAPMSNPEINKIAASLSGYHGAFGAGNLAHVSDGVVVVKPGAMTSDGRVLSGRDVAAMLGSDYHVFPVALEYGASDEEILGLFSGDDVDAEMAAMEDELDNDDDFFGDAMGGKFQEKSLNRRYKRVYGRFAKCRALLQSGKGYTSAVRVALWPFALLAKKDKKLSRRAKRCDRQQRRLMKIRQKMDRKGYDVSDLLDPSSIFTATQEKKAVQQPVQQFTQQPVQQMPQMQQQRQMGPPPWKRRGGRGRGRGRGRMMQQQGGYVPTSQAVSPYYHQDQAAMERQLQSVMPRYGGEAED